MRLGMEKSFGDADKYSRRQPVMSWLSDDALYSSINSSLADVLLPVWIPTIMTEDSAYTRAGNIGIIIPKTITITPVSHLIIGILYSYKNILQNNFSLNTSFIKCSPCIHTLRWYILGISMLILSKMILNRPVMSLRTGRPVATAYQPIINPNNLKIEGFFCEDSIDKKQHLVLLHQDIRDVLPAGLVVDDHDVLSDPEDLIRLKDVLELNFSVLGKTVVTEKKKKLGKVVDYALEPESMMIKKLYVSQSIMKSFSGGTLGVDRTQIVEITSNRIIIKDPLQMLKAKVAVPKLATAEAI